MRGNSFSVVKFRGGMTFITIFHPCWEHLRGTSAVAVTSGINCLGNVRGMMHITGNMNVNSPGSLFCAHTHIHTVNNMRNGQRATLFNVNWRVQVAKLILVPQDPTCSSVFCCSCLESFHKHKVFLEELILLDSALITHIACRQKMALQAIRWETIILF